MIARCHRRNEDKDRVTAGCGYDGYGKEADDLETAVTMNGVR